MAPIGMRKLRAGTRKKKTAKTLTTMVEREKREKAKLLKGTTNSTLSRKPTIRRRTRIKTDPNRTKPKGPKLRPI
jgi:hypothetical protein